MDNKTLLLTPILGFIFYKFVNSLHWSWKSNQIREKGKRALLERNHKYSPEDLDRIFGKQDQELDLKISKLDVSGLRALLDSGEVSSVQLVQYFARKCYVIGRNKCYTTIERFEEALDEA